ncbi:MAG: hypothetical protein KJ697_00905 [Nanoarchaeota archaeon]|nr:hypothetical protein [Nanoarchaeota archaeon]
MRIRRGDILSLNGGIYVVVSPVYNRDKNCSFTTVRENGDFDPIYYGMGKPYIGKIKVIGNMSDKLPDKFKSNKLDLKKVLNDATEKLSNLV